MAEKRPSVKNVFERLKQYEEEKQRLESRAMTRGEYEKALQKLARRLKI